MLSSVHCYEACLKILTKKIFFILFMLFSSAQAPQNKQYFLTQLFLPTPPSKRNNFFQWPSDKNLTLITCFIYSCYVVGVQTVTVWNWMHFNVASGAGRNKQCVCWKV